MRGAKPGRHSDGEADISSDRVELRLFAPPLQFIRHR